MCSYGRGQQADITVWSVILFLVSQGVANVPDHSLKMLLVLSLLVFGYDAIQYYVI